MRISELVKRFGFPRNVIEHYERSGLLPPVARTSGNYRIYSDVHVELLDFIRQCRAHAIPLDEIRQLLSMRDAEILTHEQLALLDQHLQDVNAKIAAMQELATTLNALRAKGAPGGR